MNPTPPHNNPPPTVDELNSRLRGMILSHDSAVPSSVVSTNPPRILKRPAPNGGSIGPMMDQAIVQVGATRSNSAQRGTHSGPHIGRGHGVNFNGRFQPRTGPANPASTEIVCVLDLPRVPYLPLAGIDAQVQYLQREFEITLPKIEISHEELCERETIRRDLQELIRDIVERQELPNNKDFDRKSVILRAIGSLKTGNATKGSDMDLALLSPNSSIDPSSPESPLPKRLEEAFLLISYGARLLTNTRVPIIKCCTRPSESLLRELRERREAEMEEPKEKTEKDRLGTPVLVDKTSDKELVRLYQLAIKENWYNRAERVIIQDFINKCSEEGTDPRSPEYLASRTALKTLPDVLSRYHEPKKSIDFPKEGTGIHLDINFSNHLAVHNTALLRCYNLCDLRIREMILFVKAWAKARDINSAYKRTLSSYGYVLMVLCYVVNIADPPLAPNLQLERGLTRGGHPDTPRICDGYDVQFWRDEEAIGQARASGQLFRDGRRNTESIGSLLHGFFLHFSGDAPQGPFNNQRTFVWTQEVISLRLRGGRVTKQQKNWTAARTETVKPQTPNAKPKEIRHSYLLCIEDPFEVTHNVARTVSHDGIVAIRDEFRRAARLIKKGGIMGSEPISLLKEYKHPELDRKPCFFGPNPANLNQRPAPRFPSAQIPKEKAKEPVSANQKGKAVAVTVEKGKGPVSTNREDKVITIVKEEAKEPVSIGQQGKAVNADGEKPVAPTAHELVQSAKEALLRVAPVKSAEQKRHPKSSELKESPKQNSKKKVRNWLAISNLEETATKDSNGMGAINEKPSRMRRRSRGSKQYTDHVNLKGSVIESSYDAQFPPLENRKRISFDEKVHKSDESEPKQPNQKASPVRGILSNSNSPRTSPGSSPSLQMSEVQRLREAAEVPNELLVNAGVIKAEQLWGR